MSKSPDWPLAKCWCVSSLLLNTQLLENQSTRTFGVEQESSMWIAFHFYSVALLNTLQHLIVVAFWQPVLTIEREKKIVAVLNG